MSVRNKDGYKYGTKINSLFGVNLPPRKKKIYKGYINMTFVLTGTLPSKKNQWVPATNFRSVRNKADKSKPVTEVLAYISEFIKCYIRPNNRFKEWEERTKEILVEQAAYYSEKYKKYGILFPIKNSSVSMYCYWRENKVRDTINKLESVQDILTDSGIIVADAWQNLNPIHAESECYLDEILQDIVVITLTVQLDKTYKELEQETKEQNSAQKQTPLLNIPTRKEALKGISKDDLMALDWVEEGYDDDDGEPTYIDVTPNPNEWSQKEIKKLKELGYDIDKLKEYYSAQ